MNFENFFYRIATVNQIENFDTPKNEYFEQQRFSIVAGEMTKATVQTTKFSQTNDKIFYFLNGVTSLPLGHPLLSELTNYNERKGERIEKYFLDERNTLKYTERKEFSQNEKLNVYNQTLSENFSYYSLNENTPVETENQRTNLTQTTQSYILDSKWI